MIEKAIDLARQHPHKEENRTLHAAILVTDKGEYIGYNQMKSHPFQKKFGRNEHSIFLHAEIEAIINCFRAGDEPNQGKMYVARVTKDGKRAISKPCKGCQMALFQYDIEVEHT